MTFPVSRRACRTVTIFQREASNAIQHHPTLYGLIGFPLSHSFSPAYFREKFAREGIDAAYEAFHLEDISALPQFLAAHPVLRGLNVTTPYKQQVMPFLQSISADAAAIGAVNCLTITDGALSGYNTDWRGFRDSLTPLLRPHHQAALVLGNGGASRAVRYGLRDLNIPFHTVSMTAGKADFLYADITPEVLRAHHLIVNTTTLGTEGKGCPELPYKALTDQHLLYDLIYNPPLTSFLAQGKAQGTSIKNGLEMLHLQAEASWELWRSGG